MIGTGNDWNILLFVRLQSLF